MKNEEKERFGLRVVDHFSSLPQAPFEQAESLEDLRPSLNVVHILLKLGHYQQAAHAYKGDVADALAYNVEAYSEILSLLRQFCRSKWDEPREEIGVADSGYLLMSAANVLRTCESREAFTAYGGAIRAYLQLRDWTGVGAIIINIAATINDDNRLSDPLRLVALSLDLATVREDKPDLFKSRLTVFQLECHVGQWTASENMWRSLNSMGRDWSRDYYRPGESEAAFAWFQFWKGTLQEKHLATAERLATEGKNRLTLRELYGLRGVWRLEQGDWELAATSLADAVRMARESGIPDLESETGLALAKHHLGQLAEPQREAERLAQLRQPAHRLLAQLWLALGDHEQAKHHALAAYRWAWADGEPYVHRYELTRTTELLQQMNVPIPNLPPYDPAKDEPFPWEADVRAAIEKLRAEKEK